MFCIGVNLLSLSNFFEDVLYYEPIILTNVGWGYLDVVVALNNIDVQFSVRWSEKDALIYFEL